MCSFFCKWFYSIRIFCWVFRWPKQGVMVISLQLEQYEKEENTRLGGIPMFGTEKKLAQVACLQRMVQVVSKGQSLLRSVGHCSSPEEEGWHEQSDSLCTGHTAEIPPWRWTVILGFVTVTANTREEAESVSYDKIKMKTGKRMGHVCKNREWNPSRK